MTLPRMLSDLPAPVRSGRHRAAALAVVVAGGLLVGLAPAAAHASGADDGAFLAHLNALRSSHGLRQLVETGDLNAVAAAHSRAMAGQQTIFHNASLTNVVANWQVLGENVGMGPSAAAIDTAFDHSPEHYANEVNPAYTQVGIGTASDSRGYLYVTLDFRKPMVGAPAPAPVRPPSKPPVQAPVKAPAKAVPPPVRPAAPPVTLAHQGAARRGSTPAPDTAQADSVRRAAAAQAARAATAAAARAAAAQAATRSATAARAARLAHPLPRAAAGDPLAQALIFPRALAALGA